MDQLQYEDSSVVLVYGCNRPIMIGRNQTWNAREL